MVTIVGLDPLPNGIKSNLPSIDALIKYFQQQGMYKRSYQVSELFVVPEA